MFEATEKKQNKRQPKKITPQRLKNIALYYLKRFDSSINNLRQVLRNRVNDYAYYNPEWNKNEAYEWIEKILVDFERYGYLDDARYTELKVKNYVNAGKSAHYITNKLKQKGIADSLVAEFLEEQGYDSYEMALRFARKKRIGPFRVDENRKEFRQKDMAVLLRAGFDYDAVQNVMSYEE